MKHLISYNEIVEITAQTIYHYEGGMTPQEYKDCTGKEKPVWRRIYKFHDKYKELEEHERDEYRLQAKETIQILLENGIICLGGIGPETDPKLTSSWATKI